ncbi:MAG: ABC transporter substrate-binding protein, partial [Alphaproteobacteria bacterium]|nr:ABC transporter substrate-binding protein [Alphaproteobacteria bacterium]
MHLCKGVLILGNQRRLKLLAVLFLFPILLLSVFNTRAFALDKLIVQLPWDHQFQFAGFYAALWQGYYDDLGLDVELRSAVENRANIKRPMDAVLEGSAHLGVGAGDILVSRDKGFKV